jgi:predicted acetyltransferase
MAFAIEKNGNLGMAVKRDKRATGAARKNLTGLKLPKKQAFNK